MPQRLTLLISGEIYHIFNRSIAQQPIFKTLRDHQRALGLVAFYLYQNPPLRYSHFNRLPQDQKADFLETLAKSKKRLVEILAFCIMPNHFHFLLKQLEDQGIAKFMNNFQHSYSKYYNVKNERTGSLFQAMFKGVRVESDEQLLHVSRYIHINPVSSFLINIKSLEHYPWSSLNYYIKNTNGLTFINAKPVLEHFKSKGGYKKFVFDQADYQQKLDRIKHLTLEQL